MVAQRAMAFLSLRVMIPHTSDDPTANGNIPSTWANCHPIDRKASARASECHPWQRRDATRWMGVVEEEKKRRCTQTIPILLARNVKDRRTLV